MSRDKLLSGIDQSATATASDQSEVEGGSRVSRTDQSTSSKEEGGTQEDDSSRPSASPSELFAEYLEELVKSVTGEGGGGEVVAGGGGEGEGEEEEEGEGVMETLLFGGSGDQCLLLDALACLLDAGTVAKDQNTRKGEERLLTEDGAPVYVCCVIPSFPYLSLFSLPSLPPSLLTHSLPPFL